jgi:hypothetical protein
MGPACQSGSVGETFIAQNRSKEICWAQSRKGGGQNFGHSGGTLLAVSRRHWAAPIGVRASFAWFGGRDAKGPNKMGE